MAILPKKSKALNRMLNKEARHKWKVSKGETYHRKRLPLSVSKVAEILIKKGAIPRGVNTNLGATLTKISYRGVPFDVDLSKVPRDLLRLIKIEPVRSVTYVKDKISQKA